MRPLTMGAALAMEQNDFVARWGNAVRGSKLPELRHGDAAGDKHERDYAGRRADPRRRPSSLSQTRHGNSTCESVSGSDRFGSGSLGVQRALAEAAMESPGREAAFRGRILVADDGYFRDHG